MKGKRKGNRAKTEQRLALAVILIPLLILVVSGGNYVYAKYYSQSAKNGIAIASGVYFTANYAIASDIQGEYFESIVKSGYQGTDTDFTFEVRNYENNMLFNESTVEIPYSLSFWLGETPVDATYTVSYGEETLTLGVGEVGKAAFSGHSIGGGKAMANKYIIKINATEGVKHTSVPVYVEVRTEAGAIIQSILRGKMILSTAVRSESYIESQDFVVSEGAVSDADKFTEIQKLSELTYEIRTVGEVATGDEVTEELKLSWDPAILEINRFDDAYLDFLKRKQLEGVTGPMVDESTGWNYITVEVMPYSAETVGFFRGGSFSANIQSMDDLRNSIIAVKYQESNEETE